MRRWLSAGWRAQTLVCAAGVLSAWTAGAAAQEAGRDIFTATATPPCALCHTLANAGATGEIGPNLDELKPDEDRVRRAVTGGVGNMPAYGELLSSDQIAAVARYVAKAVGAAKPP